MLARSDASLSRPVVSVHVPKTAGKSFSVWLESVFGPSRITRDYDDRPIDPMSPMNVDPEGFLSQHGTARQLRDGIRVVHGHFWARKYAHVENAMRITFLRHPVDRTISHYHYWRRGPSRGHSLHQHFLDTPMDLADFARLPQMRGFYRNYFFRDVNLAEFDFVGDTARFDEELERLERWLGVRGTHAEINRNRDADYAELQARLEVREELAAILADEIAFYEEHVGRDVHLK
jgi:hypothetical protein